MIALPKMGAPLRVLTADQIAREQKLFTETRYNIAHRARILGVRCSTLEYHLRPVKGGMRVSPRVARLIDAGNALLELVPLTGETVSARAQWGQARAVFIRRKTP